MAWQRRVTRVPSSDTHRVTVVMTFVLVMTMTMGAFQLVSLAVIANDLTDDLGISTGVFGAVTAVNTIVGALFAPRSGRVSDIIGPKRSVVLVMTIAAVGLFITAAATHWAVLLISVSVSGFGQGWCNPATNKLIAERIPEGRRGVITGVKQSGVQLGTLLAGLTLPTMAAAFNWRLGMVVYGIFSMAAAVTAQLFLSADAAESSGQEQPSVAAEGKGERDTATGSLGRPIMLLTLYALFMGLVVGGVGRFLPLFAEDQLGMSNVMAGMVSALAGGLAVGTRIGWAQVAERRVSPWTALSVHGALTVASMLCLIGAVSMGSWMVWVAAVVSAFGLNAWNAVAMLAVISGVPRAQAGRASGVVVGAFMAGLSVGGVSTGVVADRTGGYEVAWWTFAVLAAMATVVAMKPRSFS